MLTHPKIAFTLTLVICLQLLTHSTNAQAPDPRFGLVDSFANSAEATTAGAAWTRIFLRWDVIQPGGPSDWKPANVPDPLIEAEIAAGREVVAVLIGTPAWATDSGSSTAVPPMDLWGDFVYKVATQYKGRIHRWVIWNQPNVTDPTSPNYTWAGNEEDYFRLLKEAYLKIKAVDPTMQVHLAGLTPMQEPTPYLARLLTLIQADPDAAAQGYFFDVASYHVYYDPFQMMTVVPTARRILDDAGLSNKPIWINETNAPPSSDTLEPLNTPPVFKISLAEQSAYIIQATALALAGGAERVAFNKLRNEATDPLPDGLLRADNSRRPAFLAYQTMTKYFDGVTQATWQKVGDVHVVTLDRNTQTTTVLWNMARTPVKFSLNAIAAQATLIDEQGNSQPLTPNQNAYNLELPAAACTNGDYCFIGGLPRLVVESGSAAQRKSLVPTVVNTPAPPTPTPETAAAIVPTDTPPAVQPPPTLTPTATPTVNAAMSITTTTTVTPATAMQPSILPNSQDAPREATVTPVPAVTLFTVLRPERLLWLLLIGLVVFMISYGVQVMLWYRWKQ